MKFELIEVSGFNAALKGMRNPKNSWNKNDSGYTCSMDSTMVCDYGRVNNQIIYGCQNRCHGKTNDFIIGPNDMKLAQGLIAAGPEHRKFLRYIHVSFDITAPLYMLKELDTYKIGTVANSTSTMHKLASTPITIDCFETDDWDMKYSKNFITDSLIPYLEDLRIKYLETKDKGYWKELIRWLPEGWLQTRTIDLNYEVLRNIVRQRANHKLTEWHQFIDWVHTLPYAEEFIFYDKPQSSDQTVIEKIMTDTGIPSELREAAESFLITYKEILKEEMRQKNLTK